MKNAKWIVLALTLLIPLSSFAGRGRGGGGVDHKMWKELNLTEEQKKQLIEIKKANKDKMKETRKLMKESREKLESQMQSGATEEELRKTHGEVHGYMSQLGAARFETMLKIRSILTPEQRSKFKMENKEHKGRKGWEGTAGDEDDE